MALNDSQLHINVPLTDFALAYRPDENGLLWQRLLPPKVVSHTSNLIRQIDRANLMSIPDMRSGAQGFLSEVQFKMGTTLQYSCVDYGVEVIKDRRERTNADAILEYDQEQLYTGLTKINNMLEKVAIKDTLRVAANYAAANQVTLTTAHQWDNHNSPQVDPIADLKAAILAVQLNVGDSKRGKISVIMHAHVWNQLQLNPNLLARAPVHPVGGGILTIDVFQEILFGKPGDPNQTPGEVIISKNFYNTAAEGQPEDMRSFIGPDVLVVYSEPASVRNFGFGQAFMFSGVTDGIDFFQKQGGLPLVVYSYPDPKRGIYGADVDRIVGSVDFHVLNPLGGYIIQSAVNGTNTTLYGNLLNN